MAKEDLKELGMDPAKDGASQSAATEEAVERRKQEGFVSGMKLAQQRANARQGGGGEVGEEQQAKQGKF